MSFANFFVVIVVGLMVINLGRLCQHLVVADWITIVLHVVLVERVVRLEVF